MRPICFSVCVAMRPPPIILTTMVTTCAAAGCESACDLSDLWLNARLTQLVVFSRLLSEMRPFQLHVMHQVYHLGGLVAAGAILAATQSPLV